MTSGKYMLQYMTSGKYMLHCFSKYIKCKRRLDYME